MNLNPIFSNHMILQANKPVRVFGTATGTVTVELAGAKACVTSTEDNWLIELPPLDYGGPYEMTVDLDGEVDVIHWNAGLWDTLCLFEEEPHTPIDVYAYYIERTCIRIQKCFPNAKVIFATSTSVQSEKMRVNFKRYNEDIEAYNAVAVDIVKKYGFEVNDLYAVSAALPAEAHSDPTHYYTPMGTEAFANQVLSYVAAALGLDEIPEYREALYTDEPIGI